MKVVVIGDVKANKVTSAFHGVSTGDLGRQLGFVSASSQKLPENVRDFGFQASLLEAWSAEAVQAVPPELHKSKPIVTFCPCTIFGNYTETPKPKQASPSSKPLKLTVRLLHKQHPPQSTQRTSQKSPGSTRAP